MKKVCNVCGEIFAEIYGFCLECGSDDCELISEDDICPVCNGYHDTGANDNFKSVDFENCFNECYSDGKMIQYMRKIWKPSERADCEEWLNECATRTLKDYLWKEQDIAEIKAFMKFVKDCESAERVERERIYAVLPERVAV